MPDVDALIAQTANALAPRYRALDLSGAAGLLLDTYAGGEADRLVPFALELQAGQVTPDVDRDGYQKELGYPELERDSPTWALCEQLHAQLSDADDGYVLLETYFLALASALQRELDIPVLVPDVAMPIADQLRHQTGADPTDDWLVGLDVIHTCRVDERRVAALWRGEWGFHAAAYPSAEPSDVGLCTGVGLDPEVRAGWLPPGAVAVELQDRSGSWHQARAGRGAWLCVLPQRAGQTDPPIVYRDAEGVAFDRDLDRERLPPLWPAQAPGPPELNQDGDEVRGYRAEDWHLWIFNYAGYDLEATYRPIPGTILGRPHGFGLERMSDGSWRAVAVCSTQTVHIEAEGPAPERLDLRAIAAPTT